MYFLVVDCSNSKTLQMSGPVLRVFGDGEDRVGVESHLAVCAMFSHTVCPAPSTRPGDD